MFLCPRGGGGGGGGGGGEVAPRRSVAVTGGRSLGGARGEEGCGVGGGGG